MTGRVVFHPLSVRPDGDAWVIGRVDTGDFAVMPAVAHRVITLLSGGRTVEEAAQALRQETGQEFAVADFVASLDELGFVAALGGETRRGPAVPRPTMPWLRPGHVRWTLHPATAWLLLAVVTAAAALMIADPALVPRYHALIWSRHSGIVLAVNAAFGWSLVWLHEFGHLSTARAAGVPARMSLGTRLQFLAAQTDVSGVWAAPRRVRVTVYMAGFGVNLIIAAGCVLLEPAAPAGQARQLLGATALESLLLLPLQLLIFMRTDVYYLVQDLTGCANLYADGSAHVRYLARRLGHALRRGTALRGGTTLRRGTAPRPWYAPRRGAAPRPWYAPRRGTPPPADPALALPPGERRAVRVFSWVLLLGTAATLAVAAFVTVPAVVVLLEHASGELAGGRPADVLDGLLAVVIIVGFELIWARTWWRRHSGQVRGYLRSRRARSAEGGDHDAAEGGRPGPQARADRDPQAGEDRDHAAQQPQR